MLEAIAQNTSNKPMKEIAKQEAKPKTVLIEAQQYLDFKYGTMEINVTLPDGVTATLIIKHGQAFFQVAREA